MLTNERFESAEVAYKSLLYSSVYGGERIKSAVCLSFWFNIYGQSRDGVQLFLEDYLADDREVKVLERFGPLELDKWHFASVLIKNIAYEQFRVWFFIFKVNYI